MSTATDRRCATNAWALPALSVGIGIAYLIAGVAGGQVWSGVFGLCLMVAFGGAMRLAARRSETIRGLLDRHDERINIIDLRATAFTALAMITATLIGYCVELARGHSGWPYDTIAAVGGITYIVSVIVLRIRG